MLNSDNKENEAAAFERLFCVGETIRAQRPSSALGADASRLSYESEASLQVGAGCDGRIFVGAVAAADHSFIIRQEEERQRLTCAGVSCRGQQNPVALKDRTLSIGVTSPGV